jgi:hypothetical protein
MFYWFSVNPQDSSLFKLIGDVIFHTGFNSPVHAKLYYFSPPVLLAGFNVALNSVLIIFEMIVQTEANSYLQLDHFRWSGPSALTLFSLQFIWEVAFMDSLSLGNTKLIAGF